jgi:hypothetical protein
MDKFEDLVPEERAQRFPALAPFQNSRLPVQQSG